MPAVIETAITVAEETTYATPVLTGDRVFEGLSDSFSREQQVLQSSGFRPRMQAARSDRRKVINMGGEGELELDIMNRGLGRLLQAMLGTVSGPTQIAATAAYETTLQSALEDPNDSYTIQTRRVTAAGVFQYFTHRGSVVTGWSITQALDELAKLNLQFDCQDIVTTDAAAEYNEVAGMTPFCWPDLVVTLDSVATDLTEFSVEAELGLKTDRRFLRGSELKKRPVRQTVPTFTGSISMEYEGNTQYDDWIAGDIIPIVATWTGANIEGAEDFELVVNMPACQYTGESPEMSLDEIGTIALPFDVLDDGTNPAVEITYKSTDTVL